jgi:hypothetical protein
MPDTGLTDRSPFIKASRRDGSKAVKSNPGDMACSCEQRPERWFALLE